MWKSALYTIPQRTFWLSWILLAREGGYSLSAAFPGSIGHVFQQRVLPGFANQTVKTVGYLMPLLLGSSVLSYVESPRIMGAKLPFRLVACGWIIADDANGCKRGKRLFSTSKRVEFCHFQWEPFPCGQEMLLESGTALL